MSKRVEMMRALKFKLDRKTLETIYFSFIRPLFEYGSIVWDKAPRHEYYFNLLEKLQIESMRIVCGCNRYSSKLLLYSETGWQTLEKERHFIAYFYFIKSLTIS